MSASNTYFFHSQTTEYVLVDPDVLLHTTVGSHPCEVVLARDSEGQGVLVVSIPESFTPDQSSLFQPGQMVAVLRNFPENSVRNITEMQGFILDTLRPVKSTIWIMNVVEGDPDDMELEGSSPLTRFVYTLDENKPEGDFNMTDLQFVGGKNGIICDAIQTNKTVKVLLRDKFVLRTFSLEKNQVRGPKVRGGFTGQIYPDFDDIEDFPNIIDASFIQDDLPSSALIQLENVCWLVEENGIVVKRKRVTGITTEVVAGQLFLDACIHRHNLLGVTEQSPGSVQHFVRGTITQDGRIEINVQEDFVPVGPIGDDLDSSVVVFSSKRPLFPGMVVAGDTRALLNLNGYLEFQNGISTVVIGNVESRARFGLVFGQGYQVQPVPS